ncbi:MAG: CatA-like O-acetyltransferase [Oscillibacter sp.]|nr:CatA-like O-acetyltransferase [Oscillibacter sp.]
MKKIDLETWDRRDIFHFFSGMSNPFYMVTFRLDVTDLYNYVKCHDLSFYYSMCYLVTKSINQIDAFQFVTRGENVYQLDGRNPSFTDLKKGSKAFHIVTMPFDGTIEDFSNAAKEKSTAQSAFIDESGQTDDLIYISCLPWIDITGVTNDRDLGSPNAKNDSIPRVTWGKYVEQNGRKELGISLEVNHRFIDGVHIGQFAQIMTEEMARLAEQI